jgi:hypothetical protein
MRLASITVLSSAVAAAACASATEPEPEPTSTDTPTALTDLAANQYRGFQGGLYPSGSNTVPTDHAAEGRRRAALVQPRALDGQPSPNGRIVLLSIGMSNTTQEFCAAGGYTTCDAWTFVGQARADADVDRQRLELLNGARGGQTAAAWMSATSPEYDRIRDSGLAPLGLSERQVQIVWVKIANAGPTVRLPAANADAFTLAAQHGSVIRALQMRYPNLQLVFLSSRIYAGFATTALNPEPYAFESGLAVKWVIESQIAQVRGTQPTVPVAAGTLDYRTGLPWIAWGPYLWADNAQKPRSDGLFWVREDFQSDGTHPARSGEEKVGRQLLEFFKTSPFTRCWFVTGQTCAP